MDKYEITDDLLFQHCANAENFILEQIPDEEDIDYEYPKEFEKKIKIIRINAQPLMRINIPFVSEIYSTFYFLLSFYTNS